MSWIVRGLRRGILTTRYPRRPDAMPPAYRGEAVALDAARAEQEVGAGACPTQAIEPRESRARVDRLRCIQCGLCAAAAPSAFAMRETFELAELGDDVAATTARIREAVRAFGRSVHLRHVDAGSDGSEEQELLAIFNPFYDAQRLGVFLTATPRHADILVVTGPVTAPMAQPLRRAYEAMPTPKLVIALGTTACSGGIFRERGIAGPLHRLLPVDVFVPGSPPSPLTILHGLLVALGRLRAAERAS
jgi:Ni,Fe-hydrogenase III small subunit